MNLSRRSLLVRWAYWFEPRESQRREWTTLCAFCWRVFFFAPLLAILPIVMLGFLIFATYTHPKDVLLTLVGLVIWIVLVWILYRPGLKDVLIVRWMRAVKQKVCPIINFKP